MCNELSKAASPYSVRSNEDDDLDESTVSASQHVHSYDLWVSTDDVTDILLLTGVTATDASVARSVRSLKNLLPGIPEGKLCFQVSDFIHCYCCNTSPLSSKID